MIQSRSPGGSGDGLGLPSFAICQALSACLSSDTLRLFPLWLRWQLWKRSSHTVSTLKKGKVEVVKVLTCRPNVPSMGSSFVPSFYDVQSLFIYFNSTLLIARIAGGMLKPILLVAEC